MDGIYPPFMSKSDDCRASGFCKGGLVFTKFEFFDKVFARLFRLFVPFIAYLSTWSSLTGKKWSFEASLLPYSFINHKFSSFFYIEAPIWIPGRRWPARNEALRHLFCLILSLTTSLRIRHRSEGQELNQLSSYHIASAHFFTSELKPENLVLVKRQETKLWGISSALFFH